MTSMFALRALPAILLSLGLGACASGGPIKPAEGTVSVGAVRETVAVKTLDDAADDPAIWRNAADPSKSLIVATDKKAGLYVYGLDGEVRDFKPSSRLNNVDLRGEVKINGVDAVLVAASDRADETHSKLALYALSPQTEKLTELANLPAGSGEAYGLCLYRRSSDRALFAFVVEKSGHIIQLQVDVSGEQPAAFVVREMQLASQSEGCVADDRTGKLYVGEEDVGIWRFDANPDGPTRGEPFAKVDKQQLVDDVEGLALAQIGERGGYLVASSQGDSAYAVYALEDGKPMGRFQIGDNGKGIDGTSETDGIELVLGDFGPDFPQGLFIAQDGDNAPEAQNFKLVSWADVVRRLQLESATPLKKPRPHSAGAPYAAKGLADRIVLMPGIDAAHEMAVGWRTDTRQLSAEAQLALALDGPSLEARAQTIAGNSFALDSENGAARYHQVRFGKLQPDTAYVYRVKGADGWSEWLQFHTASERFKHFSFLYFGDTQNNILSIGSRVIREGFRQAPNVALAVHAGDLAAQREEKNHDDEWGEWTQAGGYRYADTPQIVAIGNHEYVDAIAADGSETSKLSPHWPLQFAVPANGAEGLPATTYAVDYQGVRFVVLDGTAALKFDALEAQTRWLDATLAASKARWNIVVMHQPVYTCARPNDTAKLKQAWKPIFDARHVDLVLQGHDHCYSRVSDEAGKASARKSHQTGKVQGPVYLVSVVGSKMYRLNDRANTQPDRVAEDTELFQLISLSENKLSFEARTASGKLYDGFELQRGKDGRNRLSESRQSLLAQRNCKGSEGPDGLPCTARVQD